MADYQISLMQVAQATQLSESLLEAWLTGSSFWCRDRFALRLAAVALHGAARRTCAVHEAGCQGKVLQLMLPGMATGAPAVRRLAAGCTKARSASC